MPDAPTAFFSYCREDSEFALKLAQDLRDGGASVWLDQLDIEPGQEWDSAVEDAVTRCQRMLVILTPASVKNRNVRNELAVAIDEGKIVIPVLYQDCAVPLQIRRIQQTDFRTDYARGLKILLKTLGMEAPAVTAAAAASVASAPLTESPPAVPGEEDRRRTEARVLMEQAAEKARRELEQERKQVAEQVLEEERRKAAVEKGRLEKEERQRQAAAEKARLEQEERERQAAAEKARLEQQERERQAAAEKARLEQDERERQAAAEVSVVERKEPERLQPVSKSLAERVRNVLWALVFPSSSWGKAAAIGVIWAVWEVFINVLGNALFSPAEDLLEYRPLFRVMGLATLKGCGFGLSLGAYLGWFRTRDTRRYRIGLAVSWALACAASVFAAWVWQSGQMHEFWLDMRVEEISRGVLTGALMVLVLRWAHKLLALKQTSIVALGFVAAGFVSYYVLVKMVPAVDQYYWLRDLAYKYPHDFEYYPVQGPCALAALLSGVMGSGVMFWQLSRTKSE